MLSQEKQDQVIKVCQEFVKVKSYSGQENKVAEKIKATFQELGFDDCFVDNYGNVIGCIKGNKPGKKVLFDAHIDTVEVPDASKWIHDPFAAEIEDNKIYGRGTSDMKGALAAMICGLSNFAKATNKDFAGEIYVAGVVHEECFEGVAARKISERVKPDIVVIGEASDCNIKIAQRGRGEIVVETYGKPAHSANPQKGINAVYKMSKLIDRINDIEMTHDDVLGYGILELVDIKSSPYPGASVVPDYCRATYDRRLLVGETKESVLKPILDLIEEMQKEDPQFKAKAYYSKGQEKCYTGNIIADERFFPGWKYSQDEQFIQNALNALKEAGFEPKISQYSFCTNGSHYAGEAGIKTLGFGPSNETLAHTIDEYIEIKELVKATKGYEAIIEGLLR
ncbi:YgeY family selenium metabolism-linked hydrolase [Clostridium cochlearium]|uniref:YgeY family selenium metabolism-linked hydrolase n=1 Tax=Clostridium cochlearium TaxID=1494 RepID=UPI00241E3FF9|nr:YgeY family selenium metabolism-linked hydrolase [Clostridium cochlearium]MBE6066038.1 YgeY family selenium metabolism-linked hydrolase [Clostridium cochlearium]